MKRNGILLINLGTPDSPQVPAVKRYLKEFLTDPRVIDLPTITRKILVQFILLTRPKKTAAAYQKIWTEQGSPLLSHSTHFVNSLRAQLGPNIPIELSMRYGRPSIQSALHKLRACQHIIVLPLFPQYSSACSGSAIAQTMKLMSAQCHIPAMSVINNFYTHPCFIDAYSQIITHHVHDPDTFLLFSYHGLPVRHLITSQCQAQCNPLLPCTKIENNNCYRAQCYATSLLLAEKTGIFHDKFSTSFQSRLGRTPWIKPYTDQILVKLFEQGVRKLAIACPSFVADNLETLEEIGMRARDQWLQLGGQEFTLIPCLNTHPIWVQGVKSLIMQYLDS